MRRRSAEVTACLFLVVSILFPVTHSRAEGQIGELQGVITQKSNAAPEQAKDEESRSPEPRKAYLRYLEARRLKGEGDRLRSKRLHDDAIRAYQETIQLDPNAADPHVDLGGLYFSLSQLESAEREAYQAIRLDPLSVGGHLLLARLYISLARSENYALSDKTVKAIRSYEKVAELDPDAAEAWAMLAELYQLKNDNERRVHALEKWANAPLPNDSLFYRSLMGSDLTPDQAYFQLSQLYLINGKNQEAIDAARRAYEADPDSNSYARNLISILRVAGTSDEELRIYSQLSKFANSPALLIGYGAALVRAGRYVEAAEQLSEYLEMDPSNASVVGLLAISQRRANQRQAAIQTLQAGLARADMSARIDLQIELAETYEELGRDDEAIAQYEHAFGHFLETGALTTASSPLFGEVVTRLINVCRRTGNHAKLQSTLNRTRRVIETDNPILDQIAIDTLRDEGKRREALEQTESAARRYPADRTLKFTKALILSEVNRSREAGELLRTMIKGHPELATDDSTVYTILSSVQMQSGDLKTAEASARKALELNPDDSDILLQLSSVLDRAGRHGESEKILRDLLDRDPDNATALNNLAYFLIERGESYQEALKLIEQATVIEPINGSFLDSLGWANYKLGNLEKAREVLEKALIYSRRNSAIHDHLGDVLRGMGKVSEARRHWEKALKYAFEPGEITRIKVKLNGSK
jgi:tetratricopeptide (TPR) repeat protein